MLTIEDYIASRKKKDKLDEFDFQKHSENMGAVIQYVMEYFNEYLNLEDYSYEQVKTQQVIDKFKEGIIENFPTTYEFIISYYWSNKKRIDKLVSKAYEEIEDIELFYLPEDDIKVAEYVCKKKLGVTATEELLSNIATMSKEYRQTQTEEPIMSDMKELDNAISDWVIEVYRKYKVDLLDYARGISYKFYEKYVDHEYDRQTEAFYYINKYDYRYQDNPFNINDIYNRNRHREFIEGHKGELEMLIMYFWLFEDVHDQDYWPEYVKLCIENERVSLAKKKRILNPVFIQGLSYPSDIHSNIKYIETKNGILKEDPGQNYVLSIIYEKSNDEIWKDRDALDNIIKNLHLSFKQFGAPKLLEFLSPYQAPGYTKEKFFEKYQVFEKGMRRYTKMKIAVINGYTRRTKDKEYLFSTVEDIACLRNTCKELKLQLKLSVDFTDTNRRNKIKKNMDDMINTLAGMRNLIIGIHINEIDSWGVNRHIYYNNKRREYINSMDYTTMSTFMAGLTTILQDSRSRYFIPNTVKDSEKLETLIDTLYRVGCCFESEETENEE
ncbi:hypothetical protein [Tissierella praeacuta]|uniref:hypothetical protein n=1 Tax=Tissierella praeacuta TaxID=43131 RepID=UPI00333F33D8